MSTSENTPQTGAGSTGAAQSQTETQTQSHADRPTTIHDAGIIIQDNGNYLLPPIQVHYREGTNQTLNIEVGRMIPSRNGLSSFSSMAMANMFRNDNNTDNGPITNTNDNRENDSTIATTGIAPMDSNTDISNDSSSITRSDTTLSETQTGSTSERQGIRGLDYPAFDVSTNGVYNDNTQPTSRFLAPLQRVFDRVYGTGTANRNNQPSPSPSSTSTQTQTQTPTPALSANSPNGIVPPAIGTSVANNEGADGTATDASNSAAATPANPNPNPNNDSSNTGNAESRNIILTVNYVYGGAQNESNSGSLFLYVPSINETNEENVNVLVRLATDIALRTIAVTLKHSTGVSKRTFEGLTVVKLEDLPKDQLECPICYDGFIDKEEKEKDKSKKRKSPDSEFESNEEEEKNSDDKEKRANSTKRAKSNDGSAIRTQSEEESTRKQNDDDDQKKGLFDETYTHYPIRLSCGHIFGASCLSEWFKTNNSCPLCREKLPTIMSDGNNDSRITITLPNLARVISNSRPLIDNFNNRQMILIPNEETNVPNTDNGTDTTATVSPNGEQFPNDLLWSQEGNNFLERFNSLRRNNQGPNSFGAMAPAEQRQSLMNFLREFVSSLSDRAQNGASANPANTVPNPPLAPESASGYAVPSPPPRASGVFARLPFGRHVTRGDSSFGGMFPPLGVESRRTANGVETREISMFDNDTNNSNGVGVSESSRMGSTPEEEEEPTATQTQTNSEQPPPSNT